MDPLLKRLIAARIDYNNVIESAEKSLSDKIEFKFIIYWQPSDGFVVVDDEGCNNAPLYKCLEIIDVKGKLTHEDYMKLTI